ncbi:hypothetical protein ACES2I_12620 [Bdellovibrio bacteriovorus]|uniref:hypothetical protein n=1 Tax=Bdellovibrio bacteriovorus TaxID=959 RepID=UPI0035A68090
MTIAPDNNLSSQPDKEFNIVSTIDMSNSQPIKVGDLISKELFPELIKLTQQLVAVSNIVNQHLKPVRQQLAVMAERISPFIQQLNKAAATYGPILIDLHERLQELDRKLNEVHERDMTFLPPFFGELTFPAVRSLLLETDKRAIDVYQDVFSKPINIYLLLQRWSANKHFTPERLEILKDALDVHIEKKYTLSIPALMNQLEGMILDIFDIDQKKITSILKESFPKDTPNTASLFSPEAYVVNSILVSEVFNSSKHDDYKTSGTYPHRPSIQHGVNSTYYKDPYASTRLIMLIDFICSDGFIDGAEAFKEQRKKRAKLPVNEISTSQELP